MKNVCKLTWMIATVLWFIQFNAVVVGAQDGNLQVGDKVELYAGGSAYVIRTEVIGIDKNGNLTVRYKTPFSNGVTTATLPSKKFWKVGDEPNPAPKNEFKLGDKVEFYFQRTDKVAEGVVSSILTNGSRYTVRYKMRNGFTRPESLEPVAMWKRRSKKKPLPAGYRELDASGRPASPAATPKPQPIRKWSSASGNFDLLARYISTQGKDECDKSTRFCGARTNQFVENRGGLHDAGQPRKSSNIPVGFFG